MFLQGKTYSITDVESGWKFGSSGGALLFRSECVVKCAVVDVLQAITGTQRVVVVFSQVKTQKNKEWDAQQSLK
jgi:hypothetical protein